MRRRLFRAGQVVAVVSGFAGAGAGRYGQILRYEAIRKDKRGEGMYEVALTGTKVLVRWFWPDEIRPLSARETGK